MVAEIRHKRLYAFYNSKVLNLLVCIAEIILCLMAYCEFMLGFGILMGVVLLMMIAYTAWLWIKKPMQIVIDKWLANVTIYPFCYLASSKLPTPTITYGILSPAPWPSSSSSHPYPKTPQSATPFHRDKVIRPSAYRQDPDVTCGAGGV